MNKKMYAVTYAVTFKERFLYQGIYYYPGVEYHFTTLAESDHPGDALDKACTDYQRRFNTEEKGSRIIVENFKPVSTYPVIKEVKEVNIIPPKKTAKVTIARRVNFTCEIEYDALEDLVASVHDVLFDLDYNVHPATITLPECDGGRTYSWSPDLAHNCFAKGRITESDVISVIFKEDNACEPLQSMRF